MKFPKLKAQMINLVQSYQEEDDFKAIYNMRNDILESIDELMDTDILDILLEVTYFVGDNDRVIIIANEYFNHQYESFKVIYYTLLSLIGNADIYQAVAFIKRSNLLKKEDVKVFYLDDGANYSNILFIDETDMFFQLAMLLINFVLGISKESLGNQEIDRQYLLYRFFDLINLIHEFGYSSEIVLKLSDDIKNIFMLEI